MERAAARYERVARASIGQYTRRMDYTVRSRYLYDPSKPFRLSRSKIDLFLECPRCFVLDRRMGVGRPSTPPFTLNVAVDALLKKEFDTYRVLQQPHPACIAAGISAVPFAHPELEAWRDSLRRGVTAPVPGTNLVVTGGVDDVWVNESGALHVVDYKATAKDEEIVLTDSPWHRQYKRQAEVYQWLFRANGFTVSDTAYFVYLNGDASLPALDEALHFRTAILAYTGNAEWVTGVVQRAYETLRDPLLPDPAPSCEYCAYRRAAASASEAGKRGTQPPLL